MMEATHNQNYNQNLVAQDISLTGKHLIEASAGTGKTFNITRIYLRMLLERELPVEQILVMTFTKDATEEIKGRIGDFIRAVINNWQTLVLEDDYFKTLATRITYQQALPLLNRALLFLDEASIFTIHGFCKRVLSQHAFASGVSFNAKMETDCQELVLQASQDWYRSLAKTAPQQYLLLAQFWQSPQSLITDFNKAISRDIKLEQISVNDISFAFQKLATSALQQIIDHEAELIALLISTKKPSEQAVRQQELSDLKNWLSNVAGFAECDNSSENIEQGLSPMPAAFMDGRRFGRSKEKPRLIEIFSLANDVKAQASKLATNINKAKALAVVHDGILIIRAKVKEKKQRLGVLSFDDLISTLANKLNSESKESTANLAINKDSLSAKLLAQYPVALVDEFQDTDPLQFDILQAIYQQQSNAALFMIGDPKQAIYGFRGGDVFAYLAARDNCPQQWLMDTNWRSSENMIKAYNRIFYGTRLDESGQAVFGYDIGYQPVKASPSAKTRIFDQQGDGASGAKALQFIHFNGEAGANEKSAKAQSSVKQSFRSVMANWCASEIASLLSNENDELAQRLKAQDIAILVRDGAEAASIKQALAQINIAAVFLSNRANIFHSEQAQQLLKILKAILFVENDRLFTAALTTEILGFNPSKLYQLQQDDLAWQSLKVQFLALREQWQYQGFISMALKLMHEYFIFDNDSENGDANGSGAKDRALTNLLHIFEILQTASQRHHQGQALLFWFEQQIRSDSPEIEAELRLESDDNLIRIVTQHGCKGLEYPVVFIPFATRHKDPLKFGNRSVNLIEYHNDKKELLLSLDGSKQAKAAMAAEAYAESIRLLYVAITRAEQRCYILTTAFENHQNSPLGQTLKWQKEDDILTSLQQLASDCPDAISVMQVDENSSNAEFTLTTEQPITPQLGNFTSKIERDWWLSSFSALTRNLRHSGISAPDRDNEPLAGDSLASQQAQEVLSSLLRFRLTKGARTGNLLHEILEHCDFNEPDWPQVLKWPLTNFGQTDFDADEISAWLDQVLTAELVQGGRLADLTCQQTLRESEFYFPMHADNSAKLSALLAQHRQTPVKDIRLPHFKKLKGMMHGFIDLIFEHQGKYYLCDYKSSHLGDNYDCYSHQMMRENIENNYYDLQYLIYALALHRQLGFLLDDYAPEQHFGGVYYFYLRGMTNDVNHLHRGIYHRDIATDELNALDLLFKEEQELNS